MRIPEDLPTYPKLAKKLYRTSSSHWESGRRRQVLAACCPRRCMLLRGGALGHGSLARGVP